ncbi:GDSL esterase/lipase [Smittium culicis]|uniref:GDSL esterase/lipase n=1 Tax=Smittium culicis TaxID=133412 RepID=A0A1R1YIJ7_9FUNG|nr:GDSL esterase/lipase [Smittium culicis]
MKLSQFLTLSIFSLNSALASNPMLVVFGDESVSSGNGDISVPDVKYSTGRSSNGPVWSEYAGLYSGYDVLNFAYPGAVSSNEFVQSVVKVNLTVPSLIDQVNTFKKNFEGKFTAESMRNDTVIISVGLNDIIQLRNVVIKYPLKFSYYINSVSKNIVQSVKILKSIGYNNFVVSNYPQLSRIPYFSGLNILSKIALDSATSVVNSGFYLGLRSLKALDKSYGNFYFLDNYGFINNLIPEKKLLNSVGITNMGSSCYNVKTEKNDLSTCSDPRKFYFYDSVNPTTLVHSFYGAMVNEFLAKKNFVFNSRFISGIIDNYNISDIYTNSTSNGYINEDILEDIDSIQYNVSEALDNISEIVSKKNSA